MDYTYTDRPVRGDWHRFADPGALPSHYFHRNCFVSFQEDAHGIRMRDVVGVGTLMWGSDYPHTESTFPRSREITREILAGVPRDEQALILREKDDPNVELVGAADGERPAIIWLFNTQRKSAARLHPPAIGQDPAWSCREFIRSNKVNALGAVACVRSGGGDA